ncbi:GlxA family transcriptional regulator [Nitrincola sp. MINF-07-Sa-05]|uniref:GlxA family transcriptional regulator n=1 Tax=Nitrincola salilacus TaxID=3400273 RepID=UPI0039180CE1
MQTPDVGFLLLPLPGFALLPFGGFLDKLRFSADDEDLSRQRYCRWQILGLEADETITASCGVEVRVQATPGELDWSDYQYLVIFGAREAEQTQRLAPQYRALLRQANSHGLNLVSIDNACFLLATAGLLNRHRVAVHWRHAREFATQFPHIEMTTDQLYLLDGSRISCAGGSAAIDLGTELISRHCGRERALKGLADMLVDETRETGHRLKSLQPEPDANRHLTRALALMRQYLGTPMTIDALAAQVSVGRRQLDRLFVARFNCPARAYWQEMRLKHLAWRLQHTHHHLAQLAEEVGMPDVGYLSKCFKRRFGVTPGVYRRRG